MLDAIDKKLLNLLEKDSRLSYTDLSKAVHLSRPSVAERVTRLLERGVVKKFTALVSLRKIGRPVCLFLHISDIRQSVEGMLALLDRDEVLEVYSVTGENNFIVKAATADLEAMEALLRDLMPYCKIVTSLVIARHELERPLVP